MIWFLLIATALCMAVYLFGPLLGGKDGSTRAKLGLLALISIVGIASIYAWKGQPKLAGKHADSLKAQYYYSQGLLSQSVNAYESLIALYPHDSGLKAEYDEVILDLSRIPKEELKIIQTVAELKYRLNKERSDNIEEWRLLANSQMQLGNYDDALKSYEKLLILAPKDEAIETEYYKAQNFIEAQKRAQNMSSEEQQAMVNNMVSGMSARLRQNGGTPEEWARLIRARKVQGQNELLDEDLAFMKKQFEDQPEIIEQILGSSN